MNFQQPDKIEKGSDSTGDHAHLLPAQDEVNAARTQSIASQSPDYAAGNKEMVNLGFPDAEKLLAWGSSGPTMANPDPEVSTGAGKVVQHRVNDD